MTTQQLSRSGGLALLVGAAAFSVSIIARSVITASAAGDAEAFLRDDSWVPISAGGAIGATLVLFGLPTVYAKIAGSIGVLGLAGAVFIALAWLFLGTFMSLLSLILLPWLADKAPALIGALDENSGFVFALVAGLAAYSVGCLLLAIPFMRGRLQPRWVAYVLLASAFMTLVGNLVLAPGGPASNLIINVLSNLGPVLLLVALGRLAATASSEDAPPRDMRAGGYPSPASASGEPA